MSLGFNSKFQDTKGKRNDLYNSVSNIFGLDENEDKVDLDTQPEPTGIKRMDTQALIQDIENDAIRFNDNQESQKMMYYCRSLFGKIPLFAFFKSSFLISRAKLTSSVLADRVLVDQEVLPEAEGHQPAAVHHLLHRHLAVVQYPRAGGHPVGRAAVLIEVTPSSPDLRPPSWSCTCPSSSSPSFPSP